MAEPYKDMYTSDLSSSELTLLKILLDDNSEFIILLESAKSFSRDRGQWLLDGFEGNLTEAQFAKKHVTEQHVRLEVLDSFPDGDAVTIAAKELIKQKRMALVIRALAHRLDGILRFTSNEECNRFLMPMAATKVVVNRCVEVSELLLCIPKVRSVLVKFAAIKHASILHALRDFRSSYDRKFLSPVVDSMNTLNSLDTAIAALPSKKPVTVASFKLAEVWPSGHPERADRAEVNRLLKGKGVPKRKAERLTANAIAPDNPGIILKSRLLQQPAFRKHLKK